MQTIAIIMIAIIVFIFIRDIVRKDVALKKEKEANFKKLPLEEQNRLIEAAKQQEIQLQLEMQWGHLKPEFICPHCQNKGKIFTKPAMRKKGISGAKVTGALLTGGISILATGLSRKENLTQAHCINCDSTWDF